MDASLHLEFAVALYFFAIASLMASPAPACAENDEDDDDDDDDADAAAADAAASLAERFLDASAPDANDDEEDAAAAELPPPEKTSNRSSLNRSARTGMTCISRNASDLCIWHLRSPCDDDELVGSPLH